MGAQKKGIIQKDGKHLLNNNNAKTEVKKKEALLLSTDLNYNIQEKYIAQTSKY